MRLYSLVQRNGACDGMGEHSYFKRNEFKEIKTLNLEILEERKLRIMSKTEEKGYRYLSDSWPEELLYSDEENIIDVSDNNDVDSALIDLVRSYPCLYAKSNNEFKDKPKKDGAWMEIADIMKMTPVDAKKRWDILRDRFTKEKRLQDLETRSGSAAPTRKRFYLFEQMSFIEPYVKRRKSIGNYNSNHTLTNEDESEIEIKKTNVVSKPKPSPVNNKISDVSTGVEKTLLSLSSVVENHFKEKSMRNAIEKLESDIADDHFIKFLTYQMKSLPQQRNLLLQAELNSAVCKAVLDELQNSTNFCT